MDTLVLHRIHFAFTITFHYLFPQLTMGLALLIVVLKFIGIRKNDARYHQAAGFWGQDFRRQLSAGRGDRYSDGSLSSGSQLGANSHGSRRR